MYQVSRAASRQKICIGQSIPSRCATFSRASASYENVNRVRAHPKRLSGLGAWPSRPATHAFEKISSTVIHRQSPVLVGRFSRPKKGAADTLAAPGASFRLEAKPNRNDGPPRGYDRTAHAARCIRRNCAEGGVRIRSSRERKRQRRIRIAGIEVVE